MNFFSVTTFLVSVVLSFGAFSQQTTSQTCFNQYADAPNVTAASLIAGSYEVKGAVPGGLWLQKGKEVYYCNAGRPLETQTIFCWTLAAPVKGGSCN
jgi:hypothetical protein